MDFNSMVLMVISLTTSLETGATRELMSMVAQSKIERVSVLKFLMSSSQFSDQEELELNYHLLLLTTV